MTTKTYTPDATDDAVAGMLVENSGRVLVDSGMEDRRAWQRNQKEVGDRTPAEVFHEKPVAKWFTAEARHKYTYKFGGMRGFGAVPLRNQPMELDLSPLLSTFHFLTGTLTLDKEADAWFEKWGNEGERENSNWLALQDEFHEAYAAHLARQAWIEEINEEGIDEEDDGFAFTAEQVANMSDDDIKDVCSLYEAPTGIYGDGGAFVEYTYNFETPLDHDFQFAFGNVKETCYVAVSIHTGMDARWGFSRPRIFRDDSYDETAIIDCGRRMDAYCSGGSDDCRASWSTDDAGSNWYTNDEDIVADLDAYDVKEGTANDAFLHSAAHPIGQAIRALRDEHIAYLSRKGEPTWPAKRDIAAVGSIVVEETEGYGPNTVYCPNCGTGTIQPGWYPAG